ncbi:hypothetical protein BOVATA_008190 [Babesia ovata]|uniref:Uncharacterized protein n=1 Tax=Babesia ovata TaxID=189622 RepID=A0A2H6K8K7_9APIC|nr:uncharacterized protein BOVATA_008190 [Babesia ovata]GBE59326.1 hypothetical protein BOVATA_008190 [Babesia ovata]
MDVSLVNVAKASPSDLTSSACFCDEALRPVVSDMTKLKCSDSVEGGLGIKPNSDDTEMLEKYVPRMSHISSPILALPEKPLNPRGITQGIPFGLLGQVEHLDAQPTEVTSCGKWPTRESFRYD